MYPTAGEDRSHSVRAYLERKSTEELDAILSFCISDANYKSYGHYALEVLDIIYEREGILPEEERASRVLRLWDKCMKWLKTFVPTPDTK